MLFVIVLGTIMVPSIVTMVPLFVLSSNLGLVNSLAGLILPFLAQAFGVFLMRQFILSIPNDLLEAARIDGASELRIYWQIVLPLCRPALATLGILTFLASWNNFLWPLVAATTEDKYTLPVALALYAIGQNRDPLRPAARRVGGDRAARAHRFPPAATPFRPWHRHHRSQMRRFTQMARLAPARRAALAAALAVAVVVPLSPAASAAPDDRGLVVRGAGPPGCAAARHVAVVHRDGRAGDRAAGGQHRRRPRPRHPVGLHLPDERRRLPVVGDRRGGRRRSSAAGSWCPARRRRSTRWRRLERHPASGQFYNWYNPATLEKLRVWPEDGSVVYPFLSSVDNAWMAAALMVVRNAVPEVRAQAQKLLDPMDFAFYYDPAGRGRRTWRPA